MMQHPFAKRAFPPDPMGKRRSTRVDYVCPIVISGRDATGQVFREETETSTVNLHGCKARLEHPVLVGMVVTLENPQTRATAKAICVHTWEPEGGQPTGEVAVQLLKPQNLWALAEPPADWDAVSQALVEGRTLRIDNIASLIKAGGESAPPPVGGATVSAPRPAAAPAPALPKATPAPANPSPVAASSAAPKAASAPASVATRIAPPPPPVSPKPTIAPAPKPSVAIATASTAAAPKAASPPGVVPREPPASASAADPQLADLEDRSWQMMDSVLQVLRDQAEELVRGTLEEFRQQVQALTQDAEDRLKQRTEQSYEDVEASIDTLRRDMADQLTHRQEEIVEASKEALHARVEEMLAAMLSPNKPPKPSSSR